MSEWIDFKELRKSLSFEKVLQFYAVEVKRRPPGNRHQGFCPLPGHRGKRRSPSFSAKLDWGVWQCFGCKARGNVLDFALLMESLDPKNPKDVRSVALKLQREFRLPISAPPKELTIQTLSQPAATPETITRESKLPVVVNAPLDFELKDLDYDHPYLKGRGFTEETIRHFGLGYCNRGLMKGRIAIPLHDHEGKLIGYAGRLVDDTAVSAERPKYLLPGTRERNGKLYEFQKSRFLYNASFVKQPAQRVVVTEGFASVWWLWQCGYRNVLALMGSDCSDDQAKLIIAATANGGQVWVFADGDEAGEECAVTVLRKVSPIRLSRWVQVERGQPTDCSPTELAQLLWCH